MTTHDFLNEHKHNLMIVGIAGYAGTGKDSLASVPISMGFLPLPFALELKVQMITEEGAPFDALFLGTKNEGVRKAMQIKGHQKGRVENGANYWVDKQATLMAYFVSKGITKFVIPDVRYNNEAQYIRSLGGKVYKIVPLNYTGNEVKTHQHVSEAEISTLSYDRQFMSDFASANLEQVKDQVEKALIEDFSDNWDGFTRCFY